MTLLIDTAGVPAPQRAEFWSHASSATYHPLDISADASGRFAARMWGDRLAAIELFRIATAPNTMTRTAKAIAAGDPDSLHVTVMLRGHLHTSQQDRADLVVAGDITSYNTWQPLVVRADAGFEGLVLRVPRYMLGEHASKIGSLTALRIPGDSGLTRLAVQFFCGVAAGLGDGNIAHDDANVAERIVDLVRGVYAARLGTADRERPRSRTELVLAAKAYIDSALGDPALGPDQVARACFISTRYLHRLFEEEGVSVGDWIRSVRLDRCRRDLLDPLFADEPIVAIASRWGIPSAPHFSRLFRATYGCCPRDFRRGALSVPAALRPATP